MIQESITWFEPTERLPDADITVLIEVDEADSDPIDKGYLDGEQWRTSEGFPVERVLRWADMPKGGATDGVKTPDGEQQ